jgi:hypothetical protein
LIGLSTFVTMAANGGIAIATIVITTAAAGE